jgi:hypothetical protein
VPTRGIVRHFVCICQESDPIVVRNHVLRNCVLLRLFRTRKIGAIANTLSVFNPVICCRALVKMGEA